MRPNARFLACSTAFALAAAAGTAAAQDRCTSDSFAMDGGPLVVSLCVGAGSGSPVVVGETFTRGGHSFTRSLPIALVGGAAVSRGVDEVGLEALGISRRLHLTIAYQHGTAVIEHAMLLPGAVVLK